jgi:periplasmic protein TonB
MASAICSGKFAFRTCSWRLSCIQLSNVPPQSASTKQSESGQFFVLKLTTLGLTIQIGLSLIEDLGFATIEALKSVPKRGLEIGGILLGRFDAARSAILIEDHEPVDSEHLHGPSWLLSPKDQSLFRHTLHRLRDRSPHQLQPVGFYRSQTRDSLSFNDQDNTIMREMFNDAFNSEPALCMLVKPSLAEPSMAQIGMMTVVSPGEDLLQPVGVFPFHAGVLREGDFQLVEGSPPVITPAEPPPQPPPQPVQPVAVPAPQQPRRIPLTAMLLSIAAGILLCAFLVVRSRPANTPAPVPTPPAATALAPVTVQNNAVLLNVKQQDGAATLSWNHDAPTIKGADYALLMIEDGRHREQLHLNKTELEAGRLVYIPRSRDISFHLQLFAQSRSTTESIRSVQDLPAAPAPRAVHPQPTPAAAPALVSEPSAQIEAPPVPVLAPVPVPAQPPPPPETATEVTAPKPTPFPEPDKTPPKPRNPEVVTTVSLELIGRSGVKEVFGHIFGSGGDKTKPPRIVRQILPNIYPALISRIHGTRQVDVKITIGPGGQVVKTELVDDHAADPIDSVVYYAARQWTFEPARNGDKPVESKVLMHFVLKRSS